MEVASIPMPGCYELQPRVFADLRGRFVKTFHEQVFAGLDLETTFREQFYSVSHRRVLRGLHFQAPPHEQAKLVYCVTGAVLDAVVDLRAGSPRYGEFALVELSAERGNMLYVPPGFAHGFYVRSETAVMLYHVSSVYAPEADSGIRWSSCGIPWPDDEPIVSERDQGLAPLADFVSPFVFHHQPVEIGTQ